MPSTEYMNSFEFQTVLSDCTRYMQTNGETKSAQPANTGSGKIVARTKS